jgi:hypothetical protein
LNQNRNNNRRRGRGNNRGGPGGGGGIQGNRIDSRARGNAPQMLEKYRKLAHDASLNGDRVQTEYYLQFADHYFRVVADSRTQKDDQRPRRDERENSSSFDPDGYDNDEREDNAQAQSASQNTMGQQNAGQNNAGQNNGNQQNAGRNRADRDEEDFGRQRASDSVSEGQRAIEGEALDADSAEDNPFTRPARETERAERPARRGRARASEEVRPAEEAAAPAPKRAPRSRAKAEESASFDPGLLPPSIPRDEEATPRPRTRRRAARPTETGEDEALEAAG